MHSTMLLLLFVLFVDGVSGADPDETLTVREGDSVPLHTGLTEILNDDTIVWKFGSKGSLISQITRTENFTSLFVTDDVRFRGRLQVDQNTGSLIIRNTRERHSGQYQVTISRGKTTTKTFNVTVQRVASGTGEVKSVPVMEGETVTLNPYPTQIHGDDLVLWTFGDILLAKIDGENKQISLNDADEGYRGRLQLDQTGSLTITNTKTTDSGHYHLQIRGSESSQQFFLTVSQPGLSSGAVAGIVVAVLLVLAAAAAGFIYHRRKISELQKQTLPVKEGEDVTLKPNKEIQKGDGMQWMFGEGEQQTSIAKFIGETGEFVTHDYAVDGRFRGRLVLDKTTGYLTIRNSRPEHSGLYKLYIISSSGDSQQRFIVTVKVTVTVTVKVGEYIILKPNKTIQKGDVMQWMFGDEEQQTSIAKLIGETGEIVTHDYAADKRFRGTLKLDKTTGSLTIRNSRPAHTGLYTLYITSSSGDSQQRFIVTVKENEKISVEEGGSVTLKPDTEIQSDYQIQWMFGKQDNVIAQIRGEPGEICIYNDDAADGRFRGRVTLEKKTGSLIITNIKPEHIGLYKLQISSSRGTLCKRFRVYMRLRSVFVTEGESVHLPTDRPKIERDDVIEWRFGDEIIAEIKGGTGETHYGGDERFRDRLQLDKITGDLTIKSFTDKHDGYYNLNIRSSKGNTNRAYRVTIRDEVTLVSVIEGDSVHLPTDRPEIERDDVIEWMFGDEIIAEIKEGTGETHYVPGGRFRDRLELDVQTGDLTIKSSTDEDDGDYNLKISSRKGNTNRTYRVIITLRSVFVFEGESVHLPTDRPEIERDAAVTDKPREESPVKGNNDEYVVEMQPLMIK